MSSKKRFQTYLITGAVAAVLGVLAAAYLTFAAYLGLLYVLDPALAALATGAALVVFAFLAVYVPLRRLRRHDRLRREREAPATELDMIEQTLREHVDSLVAEGIRRYPSRTAIGTLLLGVAAGYGGFGPNGRGRATKRGADLG